MSKSKRELSGEERALWRELSKSVKLRRASAPEHDIAPAPPVDKRAPTEPALRQKTAPTVKVASPAPDRSADRRVRRGRVEIGAKLDLHGHHYESARRALSQFLRAAHARGDRTVIVVTGVGRGGEGVIKRSFPLWLSEEQLRAIVSGYAPAHKSHGGAGAFYVFLKRRRPVDL